MKFQTIIWDFNGTIIDDASFFWECVKKVQEEAGLKTASFDKFKRYWGPSFRKFVYQMGFREVRRSVGV